MALDLPIHVSGANCIDVDSLSDRVIDLEIGNNIDEFKRDSDVQYCRANGDSGQYLILKSEV
jgi:hypothetical protein